MVQKNSFLGGGVKNIYTVKWPGIQLKMSWNTPTNKKRNMWLCLNVIKVWSYFSIKIQSVLGVWYKLWSICSVQIIINMLPTHRPCTPTKNYPAAECSCLPLLSLFQSVAEHPVPLLHPDLYVSSTVMTCVLHLSFPLHCTHQPALSHLSRCSLTSAGALFHSQPELSNSQPALSDSQPAL